MKPTVAKQFLISRVIKQAEIEPVSLSDVEKKMLHFTEVLPSLPNIYEVNAEFERTYNSDEYEAKIAGLLRNARVRDCRSSPSREQEWNDALDALKHEDHYIMVMAHQAFGLGSTSRSANRIRDLLIYIGVGVGIVLALLLLSLWKAHR